MSAVEERHPPIRDRQPAAGQRRRPTGRRRSTQTPRSTGIADRRRSPTAPGRSTIRPARRRRRGFVARRRARCRQRISPTTSVAANTPRQDRIARPPLCQSSHHVSPVGNHIDRRCCHRGGVRVAIVAESFLPHVNGVSNSVIRVLEHLRRTGHEALVIAPDTPPGEQPADRIYDGIRVHRVPSRMFPKVTTLPLGLPMPRMLRVLRGFEPDVVHLASPALLGWGGVRRPAVSGCRPSRCIRPTSRVSRRATGSA